MDVVDFNAHMIIGLDILHKEKLFVYNFDDQLVRKIFHWKMHLARKFGYLYLTWDYSSILFTRLALVKFLGHIHIMKLHKQENV